ncbi:MAG: efflux transporter outer membrane subunit [Desulfobacteraceae bacterium]|jgi:multidrug efflux system outer membrane protein|nr:efflux transporter outer membrane subunit [Desulfobacteraceae bacterium]
MKGRFSYCVLALTAYFFLYGCINLGPDYQRPDLGIQVPQSYEFEPAEKQPLEVEDSWWEIFDDGELNQLVEHALTYNWDIKQAAARILEVRARYVQVRSDRFPAVDVGGIKDRRQISGGETRDSSIVDTYDLSAAASFELDLWRRLEKASRAAWEDILAEEENRRTVAQAVVAETVSLYLNMEAVERRLQIAQQSIKAFEQSLQFVENRYRRGLTSVLDVRQASRVLAGAETLVPQLELDLGILQQQLSVLLGRYPETRAPRRQPDDYYKLLPPVPPGLPSDLLMRRPDLRVAEARLRSLNELVGAAKAARLPRITLTGEYGWTSDDLNKLLRTDNIIWNLTAGIVQPVFDAGRLKAGQRAAEARYEQGVAEYVKAVLDAFAEVEQALLTRQLQLDRRQREITFLTEARATQRVAENRYSKGLVNYLDVLNAQISRYQAEDSLVLVDLTLFRNRVALHRALGGSWAEPEALKIKDDGPFFRF